MYFWLMRPSTVSARVAGVPRPRSFMASAHVLVVDEFAGAFHGGEQRGFRVAWRRRVVSAWTLASLVRAWSLSAGERAGSALESGESSSTVFLP